MDASFINDHFLQPIADRSGYNPINTLTYALIALGALFLLWRLFSKRRIEIDNAFWQCALAWTLWGSSIRVVTDSIDAGVMQATLGHCSYWLATFLSDTLYPPLLQSHLLHYGLWTVTPGIYIVTATLFLSSYLLFQRLGLPRLSAALALVGVLANAALLLPMAQHGLFALAPLLMAAVLSALLYFGLGWRTPGRLLPVFGQALDGAATWVTIDWFGPASGLLYGEQHVVSGWIGTATPLGFGLFFALKTAFSILAVHLIHSEEFDGRAQSIALLVITILGLAPGLRDLLRVLCGT